MNYSAGKDESAGKNEKSQWTMWPSNTLVALQENRQLRKGVLDHFGLSTRVRGRSTETGIKGCFSGENQSVGVGRELRVVDYRLL